MKKRIESPQNGLERAKCKIKYPKKIPVSCYIVFSCDYYK